MLIFKEISPSDFAQIRNIVAKTGYRSCQLSVGSLYCLAEQYQTKICIDNDFLFVAQHRPNVGVCYFMPIGTGNLAAAIDALNRYHSTNYNTPLVFWGIADDMVQDLQNVVGSGVELIPDRDWAEYIYTAQKLHALSGKRLQPKRNAANQFRKNYPHFVYAPITLANIDEVWQFQQQYSQLDGKLDSVVRRGLDVFAAADFAGGIIRIDGGIKGYVLGCPISNTDFDILFENADKNYNGIFQVLEQELIALQLTDFQYINREEDLGVAGIRFAKMGLHPDVLMMKHTITMDTDLFSIHYPLSII
ncbi:hypothetical protein FACS189456_5940 [Bacteroidia bacterium]|nr:hypothetical protein FACS189456_5940 [Bacteroidia bacterium]